MRKIAENNGGRDFRTEDFTIQNQIIDLLEKNLTDLNIGNHIVAGCEITTNDVTAGYVFYDGKIRVFDDYHNAGGIPTPLNCSIETITEERQYLDGVDRPVEYAYMLTPDTGGTIDLRSLPNQTYAKQASLMPYVSGNFDGGAIDIPAAGWLALGKHSHVSISPTGKLSVDGAIEEVGTGDITAAGGNIKATAGNVEAGGKFVGDNAPKIAVSCKADGTAFYFDKGSIPCTLSRVTTGIYRITVNTGTIPVAAIITATTQALGGSACIVVDAVRAASTYIQVSTTQIANLPATAGDDSAFSLVAYW